VPAVVLGEDELDTLERTLAGTVRALEVLAGIEERVATGTPGAVIEVRAVTEAATLDARERDERLAGLREEVGLLQAELDALESPIRVPLAAQPIAGAGGASATAVTSGLDEATRALLGRPPGEGPPVARGTAAEPRAGARTTAVAAPVIEGAYVADPLGMGRACYHAGRFADGVVALATLKADPEALYWRARCLERLERLDEAANDLRRVLELVGEEGYAARRAKTDLEFVEWKRSFLKRLPGEEGG
jgi:hypothetical protein